VEIGRTGTGCPVLGYPVDPYLLNVTGKVNYKDLLL